MTMKFGFKSGSRVVMGGLTVESWGEEPQGGEVSLTAVDAKTAAVDADLVSISQGAISPRDGGGTFINLTGLEPGNTITELTGTTADGDTAIISVVPRRMLKGFSDGRHWMLRIDKATGRIKFRKGRSGRKYFVTKRPRNDPSGKGGYTAADIAAADGVSLSTVNRTYIQNSNKWGRSADFPLEMNWGFAVWGYWSSMHSTGTAAFSSNWLVLERGYDYSDGVWESSRSFISRETSGESPMHPALVTFYGTGATPKIKQSESALNFQVQPNKTWVAYDGVEADGIAFNSSCDVILTHVKNTGKPFVTPGNGHITTHRCSLYDASFDAPDREYWGKVSTEFPNGDPNGYPDHTYGTFGSGLKSYLMIEDYYDHNGWREGYNPDSNLTIYPYYPFSLNHNVYLAQNFVNTTIRRQLNFRAASQGIQNRGGGTWEDVLVVDANLVGNNLGRAKSLAGASDTPDAGNIPTIRRSVGTSAGHKRAIASEGNIAGGIDIAGYDGFLEMIIMHKANPNSPTEIARKTSKKDAWNPEGAQARGFQHRMRVHNWNGYIHDNGPVVWNRDPAVLNAATIQNFIKTRMTTAGISEDDLIDAYADFLRTITSAQREAERKAATAYFYVAWGVTIAERNAAETCVFVPNTVEGSGVLYADFPNWSTGDIPGKVFATDSVEMRGVNVIFGEESVDLVEYDAQGGTLEANSGFMGVGTLSNCPHLYGSFCCEMEISALSNVPAIRWDSGTLTLKGAVSGVDLNANGQYPEINLGPNFTISDGQVMDLCVGAQGAVGWDGLSAASLTGAAGGKLILRHYNGAYGKRMTMLERVKFDGDAAEPSVTIPFTMASGFALEADLTGMTLTAGQQVFLTGPGIAVTNNGATITVEANGTPLNGTVSLSGQRLFYTHAV